MQKKVLIGSFVGLAIIFLGASFYVKEQQSEYVAQIKLYATAQEKTIATLAQTIDQDGADAVVSALIVDCESENRKRFDALLGTLDTLSRVELQEVDSLFDACGDYFAQRRAVMVARLSREFEVYQDYVSLLEVADKRVSLTEYPVADWSRVVEMEEKRSDLSKELVRIQKDIIVELLKGTPPTAKEIRSKVAEASEVKDTLAYLGIQIDSIRDEVIGL